jgi:RimJ/RimL family protein N-acetyltransferase
VFNSSSLPSPGKFVTLELLNSSHRDELRATANDPEQFKYFSYLAGGSYFDKQFDNALNELANNERIPFAVRRHQDGKIVGSTSYYDISPKTKRLAIGHTWYTIDARGTSVNPECKYLLLMHAFETLDYERVEIHVDSRNAQSLAAARKLGAIEEGILRSHIPMEGRDYRRDTVMHSIIRIDWPHVKQNL